MCIYIHMCISIHIYAHTYAYLHVMASNAKKQLGICHVIWVVVKIIVLFGSLVEYGT